MNKLDTLYELLEKSCHDIIQSEESWLSFLKTSGYLYNFNFTNQLLIYQQRPDAKACTDFETWNNRMNRWIKKGSKGIALIDDDGRYTKIRFPRLDRLVLATPTRNKVIVQQSIGRIQRPAPGKTEALVLDIVDEKTPQLLTQYKQRRSLYKKMNITEKE